MSFGTELTYIFNIILVLETLKFVEFDRLKLAKNPEKECKR